MPQYKYERLANDSTISNLAIRAEESLLTDRFIINIIIAIFTTTITICFVIIIVIIIIIITTLLSGLLAKLGTSTLQR